MVGASELQYKESCGTGATGVLPVLLLGAHAAHRRLQWLIIPKVIIGLVAIL